jgi:hypothetical protein
MPRVWLRGARAKQGMAGLPSWMTKQQLALVLQAFLGCHSWEMPVLYSLIVNFVRTNAPTCPDCALQALRRTPFRDHFDAGPDARNPCGTGLRHFRRMFLFPTPIETRLS